MELISTSRLVCMKTGSKVRIGATLKKWFRKLKILDFVVYTGKLIVQVGGKIRELCPSQLGLVIQTTYH